MLRNSAVISISLPPEVLNRLKELSSKSSKTRSEVIKNLILLYCQDKSWEQIFSWGRKTKEDFKIKSEEDIVRLIND